MWSSLAIATAYAAYDVHSAKGSGIANRAAASFHFARLIISSAALLLLVPLRHRSESSPTCACTARVPITFRCAHTVHAVYCMAHARFEHPRAPVGSMCAAPLQRTLMGDNGSQLHAGLRAAHRSACAADSVRDRTGRQGYGFCANRVVAEHARRRHVLC